MVIPSITKGTHRLAAAALLLGVLLAGYWLIDRLVIANYQSYRTVIEQNQERLQRLTGILASEQALETELQEVKKDKAMAAYYIDKPSPTLAATDLQQQIKTIVETHGGELQSTQILPTSQESGLTRVAIRVQMNGDSEVLQKVLHALESSRPLLFVDNLVVNAREIRRREPGKREITTSVQMMTTFELAGYMLAGQS